MMRLDRLAAMVATVDDDGGSALADALATRWGFRPGTARYLRTSARAVFAVPEGYLRLVAAADVDPATAVVVAEVTAALAAAGAPVAAACPSRSGRWVELLPADRSPLGTVHATLVAAVPGAGLELADLSQTQLTAWGIALARLHDAGHEVIRTALPDWLEAVGAAVTTGDPAIAEAAAGWTAQCRDLLGPPTTCVHDDPQPDNVGWGGDEPRLFDLDDLAAGWPVVDLVIAVRDAQPLDVLEPALIGTEAGRDLLTAYVGARELSAAEFVAVPLVHRLAAAATYGRLCAALDVTTIGPTWLTTLRSRLEAAAARLHSALLAAG